ncbi:MAG: carbon storage regulator [Planctomycetaceae bacterium]|nr:carbon storage regulator [Planctomycetaceae bacterium]
MLVLSRKVGEKIHVGDGIVVEVRRIAGNRVTLAVEAPREMRILRGELLQAAKEFEAEAAEDESVEANAATSAACVIAQLGLTGVESASQSVA